MRHMQGARNAAMHALQGGALLLWRMYVMGHPAFRSNTSIQKCREVEFKACFPSILSLSLCHTKSLSSSYIDTNTVSLSLSSTAHTPLNAWPPCRPTSGLAAAQAAVPEARRCGDAADTAVTGRRRISRPHRRRGRSDTPSWIARPWPCCCGQWERRRRQVAPRGNR